MKTRLIAAVTAGLVAILPASAQSSIFVGASVGGDIDPWFLVDPDTGVVLDSGQSMPTNNISGAAFHPDTNQLLLSSSSNEEVSAWPVLSGSPDFGTSIFREDLGRAAQGLVYDERFDRILTLTRNGSDSMIHILDGDPQSLTYGTEMSRR